MINLKEELKFAKQFDSEDKKRLTLRRIYFKREGIKKESIINKLPNELRDLGRKEYQSYDFYKDNYE